MPCLQGGADQGGVLAEGGAGDDLQLRKIVECGQQRRRDQVEGSSDGAAQDQAGGAEAVQPGNEEFPERAEGDLEGGGRLGLAGAAPLGHLLDVQAGLAGTVAGQQSPARDGLLDRPASEREQVQAAGGAEWRPLAPMPSGVQPPRRSAVCCPSVTFLRRHPS